MVVMKTQTTPSKPARKTSQEKALEAFCHHIASARELNTLIRRYLDDHMELAPDEVTWANTGDANRIHNALREIAATFNLI